MTKWFCIAALAAAWSLPVSGHAAELSWHGQVLTQVRSKDELPPFIKSYLQTEISGQFRVAEIGERIRMTDVVIGDAQPDRRFLGAAHSGDTWLVAIEHASGTGFTSVVVHLFESGRLTGVLAPRDRLSPRVVSQTHDFATIIGLIDKEFPGARLGDISPGLSRAEVEAKLGPPEFVESDDGSASLKLRYPGLELWFRQGRLSAMTSTSSAYCLTTAVCPGAIAATVQAALGDPFATYAERGDSYYTLNFLCQATISVLQDKVRAIHVSCGNSVNPVLAREYDATTTTALMRALHTATAAQVLLIPPDKQYGFALVDVDAAKSRVHADSCRFVTTDQSAVAGLLDIVSGSLLGAASSTRASGSGSGDFRLGILFERDGQRLPALYMETPADKDYRYLENAGQEFASGVFDSGNLYMKVGTREKIEAWLSRSTVHRAEPPTTGQSPLPCTTAATTKLTIALPPEPVYSSAEFRSALTAGVRSYRSNIIDLQSACSRDGQTREFCGCLAGRLAAPYIWAPNGWAAYKETLQQGRYPAESNPWFPSQKYSDEERRNFFKLDEIARDSCMRDTTALPAQPARPLSVPPPAVISNRNGRSQ